MVPFSPMQFSGLRLSLALCLALPALILTQAWAAPAAAPPPSLLAVAPQRPLSPALPPPHGTLSMPGATLATAAPPQVVFPAWIAAPQMAAPVTVSWGLAGGTLACLLAFGVLVTRLSRYRSEAQELRQNNSVNDLLVQALDEINGGIVIYDSNLRAVHMNSGFAKSFPSIRPLVEAGMDMRTLFKKPYTDGTVSGNNSEQALQAYLDDVIGKAKAGEDNARTVHTNDGLVYAARDFRMGKDHFASIRMDVTRQIKQRDRIEAQAEALKTANEQLSTFSSVAAHDLRAPLRNINSLIEFALEDAELEGVTLPKEVQGHLKEAQVLSGRMMKLIEDLLNYAKVGTAAGRQVSFDPIEQLHAAIELVIKPPEFQIILPQQAPQIYADPAAFQTVMRNLISNAVNHHNRADGRVRVEATQAQGVASIMVTDDGPGIPEEFRETVFEPFKRLTNASVGSGLGLAYIKKTVEDWGGEVLLDAVQPHGSRFTVTVPTSAGDAAE